jgi:putative FmdB family regulatory protein
MPLYEYQCSACNHLWDDFYTIAKRNAPTRKPCPKCGKKKITKLAASNTKVIDPVRLGITRPDHGFKDVISKIKKAHPRHTMRDY